MNQAEMTAGMRCPVCGSPVELVCQGVGRWRVSCMRNDILEDDVDPPCSQPDVYGETAEAAVSAFCESARR